MKTGARGWVAVLPWLSACFGGGGITPVQTAFNRAVYLESVGAHDAAVAEYAQALEEDPHDWRARFNLALVLEVQADECAEAEPAAAAALRQRAAEGYRAVLAEQPDNLRASVNLAALEHASDPIAARERLRQTIAAHPDAALPRVALAAHLLRGGAAAEALEVLARAAAREPGNGEVNLLLGDASRALGDQDAARAAYVKVLERDDQHRGALLALGELELAAGRAAEARPFLERALLIDPDQLAVRLALAGACEALGDLEGAVTHLWAARRLRPARLDMGERLLVLYERLAAAERTR